jgi:hypothetical protein
MAFRTLLELSTHLDERLGWRKKELSTLTIAIQESDGPARLVNARAATCMLYAHWEGFIQQAAEAYLGFVAMRKHPRTELAPPFRSLVYRQDLVGLKDLKGASYALAIESCINGAGGGDDIFEAGVVRTGSNLWYVVFESILVTLGLDTAYYETRRNLIDESLVRRRNDIAHGKEMDAKPDEFVELRNKVLDMMDHFAVQVFVAASQKDYLQRALVAPDPSLSAVVSTGT